MDLENIRKEIDKTDRQLMTLFCERMELCEKVAEYKIENDMPVFQAEREKAVLDKIGLLSPEKYKSGTHALFSNIMDISKCLQQQRILEKQPFLQPSEFLLCDNQRIACQGIEGSNSETAARMLSKAMPITFYHDFEDVFKAVESGEADYGVLPIQNSTAGSVTQVYDLMKKYSFYIAMMMRTEIKHCLAIKKGTKLSDVKEVYSHPQALSQCSLFIKENGLEPITYGNTAMAASFVATSDEAFAAICSEECAVKYGLEVVKRDIANVYPNYTRFICITKDFKLCNDAKTVSVLLTIPNEKGSLYRLLTKFYVSGLNLEKIESRPVTDGSFNAMFYLDFEGNVSDSAVVAALKELELECDSFKFMGNYREIM